MSKVNTLLASFALAALLPLSCFAQTPASQADSVSYARFFALGVEAFDAGRFEEALENFLRAVQANPEDAEAVFDAGLAYEKLGKAVEAAAAYRHAAELRPSYKKAHARLCSALVASESFTEAVEACGRAIRLDQKDPDLYYQYGRAFAGAGLFDLAIDAFKLSAQLRPGDAEVHLRLGLAYHSLGEFRDALDSLGRAARLAPDSKEAKAAYERVAAEIDGLDQEIDSVKSYEKLLSIGDAFRLKGQYAKAIAAYKRATKLKPDDPRGYYLEGLAYYGANQYYRAAEAYAQAARLEPADGEAKKRLDWLNAYMRSKGMPAVAAQGGQN
jgi:Flp pilus assembly protein TadD